jgi:hypothetical protein
VGLHRREGLVQQLGGGLRPGWPLHLRLWGGLQLDLWGALWWLCIGRRRLGRSLCALHQVGVRRRSLELGLRLRLGNWLGNLQAGVFKHHRLKDLLFATVLALLLASL